MALLEDIDKILDGSYQVKKQKKKNQAISNDIDKILDGSYYKEYNNRIENNKKYAQQQVSTAAKQTLKSSTSNTYKNPLDIAYDTTNKIATTGDDLINYFASGKAQQDARKLQTGANEFMRNPIYRQQQVDKAILSGGNALNIAAKTVAQQGESLVKGLYNPAAMASNWINNQLGLMSDEQYQKAEQFRKDFMSENTTEKIWKDVFGWNDEVNNFVKKNSFITEDNFGGQTVQGITQLMTTAALGQTPMGWELPTFISSAGGAEQKAYQLGANDTQALTVGLIGGTLEVLTEKLGSGVVKVKGTGWSSFEKLESDLTNKISNNVTRYLAQTGVSAMNEGLEEVISGYGNAIAEKLTYMSDKQLKELYSSQDAFQEFMMATWTSLLAGGVRSVTPSGSQRIKEDIRSGRSQITGYTQNEQNIIDTEVAQRIQEAKEKGKKVKTSEIVQQVEEDLRNGDLSVESIQRGINGEKYQIFNKNETAIKDTQKELDKIEKELKDNYSSKVSKLNPEYEQLLQQQKDLSEQINVLKNNQQALGRESYLEARELSQNDALAQRSLYEYEQGGRHFEYKLDDNASERTKGLYESAAQNGNNTTKFRNVVKGIDALQNSSDESYQYRFTNTEELRQKGLLGKTNYEVQEGDTLESIAKKHNMSVDELKSMNKNLELKPGNQIKVYAMSNGLKAGNTIYLNIDSNDSLETIIGHEVTHLLEGTDDYKTLQKLLYKQAKKNGIYDSKRAEVEELYAAENADIDSELTAELAKELFTDENFINELTTKPTTFKKVLNFIDDLITKFTGSSEEVELRKIKKQFQEAFNNMKSYDESNKVQHSLGEQTTPFNNAQYSISAVIENNEDISSLEKKKSPYQTLRPNVRGGWNLDKIQKQLKSESSNRVNSKEISEFDSIDDIMENLYYHGSISAHDNLKAGSVLQESQRTGGYGEAYHTISLSGNKNIASNFASMGSSGTVMPVILKKNAYVIEMPNIEDSIELEDYLPELWDKGIDAVKIGNWDIETQGYGEQEIVILNPRAIMTLPEGTTYFQNYHKPKFQNMTFEELREALNKRYERALDDPKLTEDRKQDVKNRYNKILNNGTDNVQYSISKQDNQGRNLTKEQQEYFKDSKARDQDGNLLVMYHSGENGNYNVIDFNRVGENTGYNNTAFGYFITDNKTFSEKFKDIHKKGVEGYTKELYANITQPIIHPFRAGLKYSGEELDNIVRNYLTETNNLDTLEMLEEQVKLNDDDSTISDLYDYLALHDDIMENSAQEKEILQQKGYDAVEFIETLDDNDNAISSYAIFNSNQVKNIDNLNPTSNPDTRYSLSESGQTTDSNGKKLSIQQLEYFKDSKVVDNEGRLLEVYHGTPNPGFTVFDTNRSSSNTMSGEYGLYFTDSQKFADDFSYERLESGSMFYDIKGKKGDVYKAYLNMTNPLDFSKLTEADFANLYDNYISSMAKQITTKEQYIDNMTKWQQEYGNHQMMKGYIDLEKIAKNSDYDGIIARLDTFANNDNSLEYIVFNSNQIKNVDNLNPTTNDDINYSISNNIAPIRQRGLTYDVGVRQEQSPELIDIAPINERIDEARQLRVDYDSEVKALEELDNTIGLDKADSDRLEYLKSLTQTTNESTGQEYTNEYSPFEKAKKNLAENKVKRFIEKETYKAIDKAAKVAAQYGEFNRKEKTNLRNEFKRFSNLTSEQLTNPNTYNEFKDIIRQYADREMNFTDYHLKEVRDDIRKRKINVSDIRNQITDFNDYRRQYFGRLNLTNEGMTIDQHYQELSELYPEYFSKDITTEADMLYQLMDFMDLDTTITEKYRLSDDEIDRITSKAFSTLVTESPTEQQIQEYEEEINRSVERKRSEVRRQQLLDEMGLTIDDISVGKDINALGYQRTDPIRLNEKVFGYEVGKKINDATIRQTIHNTAEKMRWQNQERSEIEDLGIKARSKESAAVQKYGEGEYVNDLGELVKYGDKELASEFPNVETQNKIKRAAEVLRGKYDTYIDQINDVLTDLGYDAIPKRKNYFRHFIELNDKFSQWGTPFNRQTMQEQDLPTDINGLTDEFKPGKQYFASALQRKGIKTTYDAITGIDGYIETAGNLIFHTADIQRYRALSKLIRETYGQQHGLDDIDIMTEAEKNQRIEDVYGNKLSKYAAWLDEQANALAGKKAKIDRSIERMVGRKVYTAASTLKSQVGSNMTGFNVRSAMTNFASVVQGASKTSKIALLKGTISTIQNMIHDDGMAQKSDFLTGRYGTNQLSQKAWQKIANAGQIFMEASDHFTSNQIWRSKYYELLDRGMSETEAIREADDFAARVMGNRVQGATAEIFNSKTLGFLTQFQLEVNNQWSNMIHDNKMDIQSGKKGAASVVFQLGQLYGLSYMFNTIMKGLTGSDVMFDPIDLLMKIFNPDDDEKEKSLEERTTEVLGEVVNQLPMASIMHGGRIPISEAFKGIESAWKLGTHQTNEYGQNYTMSDVFDDSLESLAYWIMPTGFGQLRKTYKGTIDLDYDVNVNPFKGKIGITERPVRGSYTDSGKLRFTADNDIPGRIRSALFGQYANSEAQSYINSGYQTISDKKIPELQEFEMTSSEYRKWQKEYAEATSTTEEIDGVKYAKYKDDDGNIYLYDKNTRTLLDEDGNTTNKNITQLSKVDKKELTYDYIKNSDFTAEQKEYLFDENFSNTITDKYGFQKYTERTVNDKGKPVTKTYWYDSDTNTLYDSKYKVSDKDINNLTKVGADKSVSGYNSFDTYEEFDYSYKNPDKYKLIQDTGSYKKYKTNETYQKAVDWAYNTPVNYTLSKAISNNIEDAYKYMEDLDNIKSDKDKNGKSINGSRKPKVVKYINSLNISDVQKAMLMRTQYSSYNNYNYEIINYLNNQTNITLEEEYRLLEKLKYNVKNDTVSW